MAIPSNTPAHSKHRRQDILGADDKVPSPLKHNSGDELGTGASVHSKPTLPRHRDLGLAVLAA